MKRPKTSTSTKRQRLNSAEAVSSESSLDEANLNVILSLQVSYQDSTNSQETDTQQQQQQPSSSLLSLLNAPQPSSSSTTTVAATAVNTERRLVVHHEVPSTSVSTAIALYIPLQSDQGWQETKSSLTSRAAFLLNSRRMSDISFLIGENKVEMYGHKTILAMGSPVFEAQFFGSLSSNSQSVIELQDVEPQTFLLFLKYLYTDAFDTSQLDDNAALALIKPAKMYIVPILTDKCSDFLMAALRPENCFTVYNHATFYEMRALEGACLRYMERMSEDIVSTDEFTQLDIPTLTNFLQRDGLSIAEENLFHAVVRWASAECRRREMNDSDDNIRSVLDGNLLRLIRFPVIEVQTFASDIASRNILTAEEVRAVFIYMCGRNPTIPSPGFPVEPRKFRPALHCASRFTGTPTAHHLNYRSGEIYNYRINFKSDRKIYLKGVKLFTIKCGSNGARVERRNFSVGVHLSTFSESVADRTDPSLEHKSFSKFGDLIPDQVVVDEAEVALRGGPDSPFLPVLFNHEVLLPANEVFSVCVAVSSQLSTPSYQTQALHTFMGTEESSQTSVTCEDGLVVNIKFINSGEVSGNFTQAQIPEIIFAL